MVFKAPQIKSGIPTLALKANPTLLVSEEIKIST